MLKEYKSLAEVAGPLMLVHGVEGVTYNEIGEITLANGEIRRCKVLEVNGSHALVQLFENAVASTFPAARSASSDAGLNSPFRPTCSGVCSTVSATPSTVVRRSLRRNGSTSTACP